MEEKKQRQFKDELTKSWFVVGWVFLAILIPTIIVFLIWGNRITHGKTGCAILLLLHIYCPGCGGTRAFNHFVHGNVWRSFVENPFVPYVMINYVVFMVNTILVKTTKKLGFEKFPVTIIIYVGIGVLFVQWIIRNILFVGLGLTVL